jgi:cytochrome P450
VCAQNVDAGSEFMFGESFNALLPGKSAAADAFNAAWHRAETGSLRRFIFGKTVAGLLKDDDYAESSRFLRKRMDEIIDRATARGKTDDKYYLIDDLLEKTSDRKLVKDNLMQVFLGGHEGVGAMLTNTIFLVARHPRVWNRIRIECQELSVDDLTFERLKTLRYLEWTIKEGAYRPAAHWDCPSLRRLTRF